MPWLACEFIYGNPNRFLLHLINAIGAAVAAKEARILEQSVAMVGLWSSL